jgi:hypothetical protein
MKLEERIEAFAALGNKIDQLTEVEKHTLADHAGQLNAWFTPESVFLSLEGIRHFLHKEVLVDWTSHYNLVDKPEKIVGVAMAGNIPLVGFHDLLCILISGHQVAAKKSSQDSYLIGLLCNWLIELNPGFQSKIKFEERLNHVDAVIATGSDNSSRYFEYYFRKIPHIIRKNRSSCAVLMGEEDTSLLTELGKDVFTYFGLGCRNVSKIYVPEDYNFPNLLDNWEIYQPIIHHAKYANNYDYQKSIMLVNSTPFYDNGFVMLTESKNLVSPISVIFYERYKDLSDLKTKLSAHSEKIQCIVSANGWFEGSLPFGKAQLPDVTDYADQVDTMRFLESI